MTEQQKEGIEEIEIFLNVINARIAVPRIVPEVRNREGRITQESYVNGTLEVGLYQDNQTIEAFKRIILNRLNQLLPANEKLMDYSKLAQKAKEVIKNIEETKTEV